MRGARWRIAVACILVAGSALRLAGLGHVPGLNADETWYGIQVQRHMAGLPIQFRAPSGRLNLNVLMFALLAPMEVIAGPAIWVLRAPATLASVLTAWGAFTGLRSHFGRTCALTVALVLFSLPVDIAYSRFGWDPSLLGPFVVGVLAFAVRGRWWWATTLLAAAILVHPTAVFVLPVAVALTVAHAPGRLLDGGVFSRVRSWGEILVVSVGLLFLTRRTGGTLSGAATAETWWSRLADPELALEFVRGVGALMSGRTVHEYIVSGTPVSPALLAVETAALAAGGLLLLVGMLASLVLHEARTTAVLLGTGTSMAALYLQAGLEPVTPGTERYAVYAVPLVVLSLTSAARVVVRVARRRACRPASRRRTVEERGVFCAVVAVNAVLLMCAYFGYLRPLQVSGSQTYRAFSTAHPDPRQQAWSMVAPRVESAGAVVHCEDWWICLPLRYFAGPGHQSAVVEWDHSRLPAPGACAGDLVVAVAGGELDVLLRNWTPRREGECDFEQFGVIVDLQSRPVYVVRIARAVTVRPSP